MNVLRRRSVLLAALAAPFGACRRMGEPRWEGGWVGAGVERGHRLRESGAAAGSAPARVRRAGVIDVGAGIAALGAARALMQAGIDDVQGLPPLFDFPPDMARVPAEVNRLSNQVLVQTFEEEWGQVER